MEVRKELKAKFGARFEIQTRGDKINRVVKASGVEWMPAEIGERLLGDELWLVSGERASGRANEPAQVNITS